jgi:TonB family protein
VRRVRFALMALLAAASPAAADITIASINASTPAQPSDGPWTVFVKGGRVRYDAHVAGQRASVLTDIPAGEQWLLNHTTREVAPFRRQDLPTLLLSDQGEGGFTFAPNGRTKSILGRLCRGYTPGGSWTVTRGGHAVTIRLAGESWVDEGGPGVAEFLAARRAMDKAGLSYEAVQEWKPIAEAAAKLAAAGILMEQELCMTVDAPADVAKALDRPLEQRFTQKVVSISLDPVPEEQMSLPPGYRTPAVPTVAGPGTPGVVPPVVLHREDPSYTPATLALGIEGTVKLSCTVMPDGTVGDVKVSRSLWPTLDAEAVNAARRWRFRPGTLEGKPVPFIMDLEMAFRLRKEP